MRRRGEPIFFVDENLDSDLFVGPVLRAGLVLRRHRDHFDPGTPDEDWIPWVARKGWLALTPDKRILRNRTQSR